MRQGGGQVVRVSVAAHKSQRHVSDVKIALVLENRVFQESAHVSCVAETTHITIDTDTAPNNAILAWLIGVVLTERNDSLTYLVGAVWYVDIIALYRHFISITLILKQKTFLSAVHMPLNGIA